MMDIWKSPDKELWNRRLEELRSRQGAEGFQKEVRLRKEVPGPSPLGIGTLAEKSVHALCKFWACPDGDCHEIPIGPYVADIWWEGMAIEVQTAGFGKLRAKLSYFLEQGRVMILHPLPVKKYLIWLDGQGKAAAPRLSPKRGRPHAIFRELYSIKDFLCHGDLRICLLLADMEEYRLLDGWGRGGKRGSHRYDRRILSIEEVIYLERREDYYQFLPPGLGERFGVADLAREARIPSKLAWYCLDVLTALGIVERLGRAGRSWVYGIREAEGEKPWLP